MDAILFTEQCLTGRHAFCYVRHGDFVCACECHDADR